MGFELDGRDVAVESYACTCRGPDEPHRHWLLRVDGLEAGTTVEIARSPEGGYSVSARGSM